MFQIVTINSLFVTSSWCTNSQMYVFAFLWLSPQFDWHELDFPSSWCIHKYFYAGSLKVPYVFLTNGELHLSFIITDRITLTVLSRFQLNQMFTPSCMYGVYLLWYMLLNAAGAIIFLLRSFSNRYLNDKMGKYSCLVVCYVLKAYERI